MNRLRVVILCISIFLFSSLYAAPINTNTGNTRKELSSSKQKTTIQLPIIPTNSDETSWGIKSGLFVGAGAGIGMMLFSTPSLNNGYNCSDSDCGAKDLVIALDYTARLGLQHYFTLHQGIRTYASYTGGYGFPPKLKNMTFQYMNESIDFNIDYLLELVHTKNQVFGAILGVYAGYTSFYRSQEGSYSTTLTEGTDSLSKFIVGINVGVGYTFMRHHRFDIMAKIPLLSLYNVAGVYRGNIYIGNGYTYSNDIYYRYTSVNVSYNFIF